MMEKVYCNECKYYHFLSALVALKDTECCFHPNNNFDGMRKEADKINENNDCDWFELATKEDIKKRSEPMIKGMIWAGMISIIIFILALIIGFST